MTRVNAALTLGIGIVGFKCGFPVVMVRSTVLIIVEAVICPKVGRPIAVE